MLQVLLRGRRPAVWRPRPGRAGRSCGSWCAQSLAWARLARAACTVLRKGGCARRPRPGRRRTTQRDGRRAVSGSRLRMMALGLVQAPRLREQVGPVFRAVQVAHVLVVRVEHDARSYPHLVGRAAPESSRPRPALPPNAATVSCLGVLISSSVRSFMALMLSHDASAADPPPGWRLRSCSGGCRWTRSPAPGQHQHAGRCLAQARAACRRWHWRVDMAPL